MKQILLTLAMSIAICFSINAQTITWDGGAGTTSWTDAMNWDTDMVPVATDQVVINDVTVDLASSTTVQRIDMGGTSVLNIAAAATLTVDGFTGNDDGFEIDNSASVTNDGILNVTNHTGGTAVDGLYIRGTVTNNGTILISNIGQHGLYVQRGTLTNNGTITSTDGGQVNGDGDNVYVDDSGGVFGLITNNGTININKTSTTGDDNLYVNDGASIENNGTFTITGMGDNGIRLDDAGIFNNNAGANFSVDGGTDDQILVDNSNAVFNNFGTVTLTNTDAGDAGLYVIDAGLFMNMATGIVNISNSSNYGIQIDANGSTAEIINNGTMTVTGGSNDGVRIQESGLFTNNGTLNLTANGDEGIQIDDSAGPSSTFDNAGIVNLTNIADHGMEIFGTFNNLVGGVINGDGCVDDGIRLQNSGLFNNSGDIRIDNSGSDDIETETSASWVNMAGATFAPGSSPGDLEIRDDYVMGPATITFEINGTSNVADYDVIEQTGPENIDVTGSTANLVWGYTPADGDCYQIVRAVSSTTPGTVSGTFASVTDTGLDPAFTYTVDYSDPLQIEICVELIVVPVELVSFTAQHTVDGNILDWQTANEINNEGFQIERSLDGRAWEMIDFVEGQGNSDQFESYEYLDTDAQAGVNYYRLKQMDFDGQYEYSEVVLVESEASQESRFSLYPNPVENELFLELDREIQNLNIRLVDTNGRLVWSHQGWAQSIPFGDIGSGLYILSIEGTDFQEIRKITRK